MLDYGFANFALYTPALQEGASVPVKLGVVESVAAVPSGETALLVDKAQRNSITAEITLEESVTAPVSRGQRLGEMTVRSGEQILARISLVAECPVARLTVGELMGQILRAVAMAG